MAKYEIVEDNWALHMKSFSIKRDGVYMKSTELGGITNDFKTIEAARQALEKLKFKPSRTVVYEEEF